MKNMTKMVILGAALLITSIVFAPEFTSHNSYTYNFMGAGAHYLAKDVYITQIIVSAIVAAVLIFLGYQKDKGAK